MEQAHELAEAVHTERIPTNWELSTARATNVLRNLSSEARVDATRLPTSGFADTRPLSPNVDDTSRAANRRVEFVFRRRTERTEASSGVAAPEG